MSRAALLARLAAASLLAVLVLAPGWLAPLFRPLVAAGAPVIYTRASLLELTLAHLGLVAAAGLAGAVVALPLAVFVTRPAGAEFLALARTLIDISQTFPPVAVLALAVPAVGFGTAPVLIALFVYGLLPVFENALAGLRAVPAPVLDAARGMGMGPLRRLLAIELPFALPLIVAGIRLSVVINMGTATIGSTVAAKGLGEVVIAGLLSDNQAFVLQGGLIVALLALLLYDLLGLVEDRLSPTGRIAAATAGTTEER